MMFTIEKNHPIPPDTRTATPKGAVRAAMETLLAGKIGDSVFVPGIKRSTVDVHRHRWFPRGVFTIRTVEGGVRIWKIAEPS